MGGLKRRKGGGYGRRIEGRDQEGQVSRGGEKGGEKEGAVGRGGQLAVPGEKERAEEELRQEGWLPWLCGSYARRKVAALLAQVESSFSEEELLFLLAHLPGLWEDEPEMGDVSLRLKEMIPVVHVDHGVRL